MLALRISWGMGFFFPALQQQQVHALVVEKITVSFAASMTSSRILSFPGAFPQARESVALQSSSTESEMLSYTKTASVTMGSLE